MKTLPVAIAVSLSWLLSGYSLDLLARPGSHDRSAIHTNTPPLNYRAIRDWQKDKTTEQQIKNQLGLPTIIDATRQHTQWYYKTSKASLSIQFNADHTVAGFQYNAANGATPQIVQAEQLTALVAGTTDLDLIRLFGEPTYMNLSAAGKELSYIDKLTQATLQLVINEPVGLITSFHFFEKGVKKSFIDTGQVMTINRGQTTRTDIVNLFGPPTMKTIEQTKESWYYEADNARLWIDFNQDNKTVRSYQSQQR